MCPVSPSPFQSSSADFVRAISRKFPDSRFLIVGASSQEVERQFAEAKREASVVSSTGDLATKLGMVRPRRTLKQQFGFILLEKTMMIA
jgi:hypothetical protein